MSSPDHRPAAVIDLSSDERKNQKGSPSSSNYSGKRNAFLHAMENLGQLAKSKEHSYLPSPIFSCDSSKASPPYQFLINKSSNFMLDSNSRTLNFTETPNNLLMPMYSPEFSSQDRPFPHNSNRHIPGKSKRLHSPLLLPDSAAHFDLDESVLKGPSSKDKSEDPDSLEAGEKPQQAAEDKTEILSTNGEKRRKPSQKRRKVEEESGELHPSAEKKKRSERKRSTKAEPGEKAEPAEDSFLEKKTPSTKPEDPNPSASQILTPRTPGFEKQPILPKKKKNNIPDFFLVPADSQKKKSGVKSSTILEPVNFGDGFPYSTPLTLPANQGSNLMLASSNFFLNEEEKVVSKSVQPSPIAMKESPSVNAVIADEFMLDEQASLEGLTSSGEKNILLEKKREERLSGEREKVGKIEERVGESHVKFMPSPFYSPLMIVPSPNLPSLPHYIHPYATPAVSYYGRNPSSLPFKPADSPSLSKPFTHGNQIPKSPMAHSFNFNTSRPSLPVIASPVSSVMVNYARSASPHPLPPIAPLPTSSGSTNRTGHAHTATAASISGAALHQTTTTHYASSSHPAITLEHTSASSQINASNHATTSHYANVSHQNSDKHPYIAGGGTYHPSMQNLDNVEGTSSSHEFPHEASQPPSLQSGNVSPVIPASSATPSLPQPHPHPPSHPHSQHPSHPHPPSHSHPHHHLHPLPHPHLSRETELAMRALNKARLRTQSVLPRPFAASPMTHAAITSLSLPSRQGVDAMSNNTTDFIADFSLDSLPPPGDAFDYKALHPKPIRMDQSQIPSEKQHQRPSGKSNEVLDRDHLPLFKDYNLPHEQSVQANNPTHEFYLNSHKKQEMTLEPKQDETAVLHRGLLYGENATGKREPVKEEQEERVTHLGNNITTHINKSLPSSVLHDSKINRAGPTSTQYSGNMNATSSLPPQHHYYNHQLPTSPPTSYYHPSTYYFSTPPPVTSSIMAPSSYLPASSYPSLTGGYYSYSTHLPSQLPHAEQSQYYRGEYSPLIHGTMSHIKVTSNSMPGIPALSLTGSPASNQNHLANASLQNAGPMPGNMSYNTSGTSFSESSTQAAGHIPSLQGMGYAVSGPNYSGTTAPSSNNIVTSAKHIVNNTKASSLTVQKQIPSPPVESTNTLVNKVNNVNNLENHDNPEAIT